MLRRNCRNQGCAELDNKARCKLACMRDLLDDYAPEPRRLVIPSGIATV